MNLSVTAARECSNQIRCAKDDLQLHAQRRELFKFMPMLARITLNGKICRAIRQSTLKYSKHSTINDPTLLIIYWELCNQLSAGFGSNARKLSQNNVTFFCRTAKVTQNV